MRASLVVVLTVALASCGGGGGGGGSPRTGDGTFTPGTPIVIAGAGEAGGLVAADFDGDHLVDLAVATWAVAGVHVFLGRGDGTFDLPLTFPLPAGCKPDQMVGADLDGDTQVDLVVGGQGSNQVFVLLGVGDGTFVAAPSLPLPVGTFAAFLACADFDGDTVVDVAASVTLDGSVAVFVGNGDGTFAAATPEGFDSGPIPCAVVAGSWDGDAAVDLAVVTNGDDSLEVFVGAGDGTFAAATPASVLVGDYPYFLLSADVDGDGLLDLVSPAGQDDTLDVLLGNGDGTFTAAPVLTGIRDAYGGVARDFDADGRLDLVVSNVEDDTLSILLGHGDGTFGPGPQPTLPTGNRPRWPVSADFDGDGIFDLAASTATDTDGGISVFLGNAR